MTKQRIESVNIKWNNFILEVTGFYQPEIPAIWNFSNGDPGIPGEQEEFYIESISLIEGELLDFALEIESFSKSTTSLFEEVIIDLAIQKIEYDNL